MDKDNVNKASTVITIVVFLVLAILLFAWLYNRYDGTVQENNRADEQTVTGQNEEDQSAEILQLTEVASNPQNYIGEEITLEGSIKELFSNRVIMISDTSTKDVLAVLFSVPLNDQQSEQADRLLQTGTNVRVKGEIIQTTPANAEKSYDIDLTSEAESQIEDKVILVADSVIFTDQEEESWYFPDNAPPVTD